MTAVSKQPTVTTPSDLEIRYEKTFDAPIDVVWRAFTEPDLLASWWGRGHNTEIVRMEVKNGGRWRFIEQAPGGAEGFEGRYREVVPQQRLVQTFEWDGRPSYISLATAEFESLPDGRTKLTDTTRFFTAAERDEMLESGMEEGLQESMAALDDLLTSLVAEAADAEDAS